MCLDALLPGAVRRSPPQVSSALQPGTLSALSETDRPGLVSTGLIQGGGHLLPDRPAAAAPPAARGRSTWREAAWREESMPAPRRPARYAAGGLPALRWGGWECRSPRQRSRPRVMPPAAGSGGEEEAADTMPASQTPLDACGLAGVDAVPVPEPGARRRRTSSPDWRTSAANRTRWALDAFFGSVSQVEGIGGGISAGRVDAPPPGGLPRGPVAAAWIAHAAAEHAPPAASALATIGAGGQDREELPIRPTKKRARGVQAPVGAKHQRGLSPLARGFRRSPEARG